MISYCQISYPWVIIFFRLFLLHLRFIQFAHHLGNTTESAAPSHLLSVRRPLARPPPRHQETIVHFAPVPCQTPVLAHRFTCQSLLSMTKIILAQLTLCYHETVARHVNEYASGSRCQHARHTYKAAIPARFASTQDDAMTKRKPSVNTITSQSMVQDIILRYPQTIAVFNRHRLACPGCYISPHHTIADTAREYTISVEPLLADLNGALPAEPV